MKEVISILVAIMSALLTFYLANRLTLNDSMDSKSGWRKELMDIASKEKITLADIYRIRASVRYYPHQTPTRLSFRWMTNLIIKLCDGYFVEAYRNKEIANNVHNIKKIHLTKSRNKRSNYRIVFRKFRLSKSKRLSATCSINYGASQNSPSGIVALPETDEIVRIICRYLLKYHWEARQKMRIFRRGRDLMNINDDEPSEAAARTIQLILEQVKKMSDNQNSNDNIKKITETIDKTLKIDKDYENKSNSVSNIIHSILISSLSALIFNIAYKILTLNSISFGSDSEIKFDENTTEFSKLLINYLLPVIVIFVAIIGFLISCWLLKKLCSCLKKCISLKNTPKIDKKIKH